MVQPTLEHYCELCWHAVRDLMAQRYDADWMISVTQHVDGDEITTLGSAIQADGTEQYMRCVSNVRTFASVTHLGTRVEQPLGAPLAV